MNSEEWEQRCTDVKNEMMAHVSNFVTPISMSEEQGSGVAWGSGGYLGDGENSWLITASHVFSDAPKGAVLAHLPRPGEEYVAINAHPDLARWPVDVAAVRVARLPVNSEKKFIPKNRLAQRYSAVESELLFWIGFPGFNLARHDPLVADKRRGSMFGELQLPALGMLSQSVQGDGLTHQAFDQNKHIEIMYPNAARKAAGEPEVSLPHAKGMSGSILWNTRYVEMQMAKRNWSPLDSVVCGVVWGALEDPEVILATRIECIRESIKPPFS